MLSGFRLFRSWIRHGWLARIVVGAAIDRFPVFIQDQHPFRYFRIIDVEFRLVKPCTRCIVTSLDPLSGEPGANPLPALRAHRYSAALKGVTFGQNALVIAPSGARLHAGQAVDAH